MSSVYNLEPPTKGKVILKTSLGDLEVELWAKETPKACRNFVQLCLEGYYDNIIFHRIIKDYLVQGGDPAGTGEGSESIYGELFKDEFHSRLKFSHRGLVACANQNRPNSNGSQFFITLEKTDWLDKQNTIFGRVVGDTIYNLLRMGECATDEGDRPLDPPVLREVDVVWNPFDDIVPRRDARKEREEARRAAEEAAAAAAKKAAARSSKKNLSLLSFGEEAEEEEQQLGAGPAAKIKSAHDLLEDKRLAKEEETPEDERIVVDRIDRPMKRTREEEDFAAKALGHTKARLAAAAKAAAAGGGPGAESGEATTSAQPGEGAGRGAGAKGGARAFGSSMHEQMVERRRQMGDTLAARAERAAVAADGGEASAPAVREDQDQEAGGRGGTGAGTGGPRQSSDRDVDEEDEEEEEDNEDGEGGGRRKGDFRSERNERIESLRMETKRQGIGRMAAADEVTDANLLKPWQLAREQYKQRKKIVGDREKTTLARLAKFSQALKKADAKPSSARKEEAPPPVEEEQPEVAVGEAGYSGKVRTDIDHKSYLPPSWRVDDYLEREDLDASLDDLKSHKLEFKKASGRTDNMARNIHDNDDYLVIDPLLEKGMHSFSKAEQGKKKRANEWSQKPKEGQKK